MNKSYILNSIKLILCSSSFLILCGCAAISGHKDSMNQFDGKLDSNNCEFAEIDKKIEKEDDPILWGIQGGTLARNCLNYTKSNELFDEAEKKYKESVDKDSIVNNTLESSASILVNNNINNYEGNTYEKVMVNTYKALNFISLNDKQNARIEFNRALDRQRRAKEYFEKEIKEKKNELVKSAKADNDDEKKEINPFDSLKVAENKNTQEVIYKEYNNLLNDFEAYPNFINPFTTYISGIYFLLDGDSRKARDLLKESMAMDPDNEQIKKDYELSKKYSKSLKRAKEKYAWIIYENGKGMVKDEIRIDIPLFLFTNNVKYTGIALPKITERSSSYEYLDVNGRKTIEVCNMDNVIKTEFKKRFPTIVTEAVFNTVVKTVAQKQLNDASPIAGIVGALYQGLTNKADVRSWTTLPKNFQSVSVKLDGNPIKIKNNDGKIIKEVLIPSNKNALIYVKSQKVGNERIHEILF